METIVEYAQELVYSLLRMMPGLYQKASFKAVFGRFVLNFYFWRCLLCRHSTPG